jgi:hypothetical protein
MTTTARIKSGARTTHKAPSRNCRRKRFRPPNSPCKLTSFLVGTCKLTLVRKPRTSVPCTPHARPPTPETASATLGHRPTACREIRSGTLALAVHNRRPDRDLSLRPNARRRIPLTSLAGRLGSNRPNLPPLRIDSVHESVRDAKTS